MGPANLRPLAAGPGSPTAGQPPLRVPRPLPPSVGPAPAPPQSYRLALPHLTQAPTESSGLVLEAAREGPHPSPPSPSPTSACHLCVCHTFWPRGRGGAGGTGSVCLCHWCLSVCLQFLVCVWSMPCASAHSIAHRERPLCGVPESWPRVTLGVVVNEVEVGS